MKFNSIICLLAVAILLTVSNVSAGQAPDLSAGRVLTVRSEDELRNVKDKATVLEIVYDNAQSLRGLDGFENVNKFSICMASGFASLDGIEALPQLNFLKLYGCNTLSDLSALSKTNVRQVQIEGCNLIDLSSLKDVATLQSLSIIDCELDWKLLGNLTQLRQLLVSGMDLAPAVARLHADPQLAKCKVVVRGNIYREGLHALPLDEEMLLHRQRDRMPVDPMPTRVNRLVAYSPHILLCAVVAGFGVLVGRLVGRRAARKMT